MSNLPKVEKFGLTIPLKSLAEQRFKSPAVSIINEQDLLMFLVKLISETYFKCGVKVDAQELKAISSSFKDELKLFPYLTLVELQKCFHEGYKERYGKYYGLNIKTFVQWVDYYIQNERNDDLNKLKPPKVLKKETITEEQKRKLVVSGMKKCLDYYSEHFDILNGYTLFLYDVFYDDGFLPTDNESKYNSLDDAKQVFEFEISSKKPNSKQEHLEIKETLEQIQDSRSMKLINKAKELIVLKFLRETFRDKNKIKELKEKYIG